MLSQGLHSFFIFYFFTTQKSKCSRLIFWKDNFFHNILHWHICQKLTDHLSMLYHLWFISTFSDLNLTTRLPHCCHPDPNKIQCYHVKGSRTCHSKIYYFGMLIILCCRYLRNSRCRKGFLTSSSLPKSRS